MSTAPSPSSSRTDHAPAHELATHIVDAMADRKATDITVLDLRSVGGVADYFIVATGASDRQIRAIVNAVDEEVKDTLGEAPWHIEGKEHLQWVVMDYVNVVAHVFSKEKREYYDLERLWGDADIEHVPDEAGAAAVKLLQQRQPSSDSERPSSE